MISGEKRFGRGVSVWPGYVDALSALLMVVIFVLLVFTIAQFLLTEILSGQESELASLHRQMARLTDLLGLEKERGKNLAAEVHVLSGKIDLLKGEKEALASRVGELSRQTETDQAEMKRQLLLIAGLQEDIDALSRLRRELEQRVGDLSAALEGKSAELGAARDRTKALEARLAGEEERTLLAQKEVDQSEIRIQALSALVGQQEEALEDERKLSASANAEVALLQRQLTGLKQQLEEIGQSLKKAESEKAVQAEELKDLGRRLNIVLAREVNKLERYRSEFFGRLREIIGKNPQIRVEGDRFVLQAELLFESGSASLGEEGKRQLARLAETLRPLTQTLPKDLQWILRVDGHTDRIPINNSQFASNWELSTARALSVVRFLADQGIPPDRMTAAGFSKYHPIDPADTKEAYRKNRRIEIKLTSR